jgi:putative ABC transport system permease protein
MRKLLRRLGHVLRPRQFDAELDEELAFHHEMKRHELALKGVGAAGAVDRALGNLTLVKEESREVWIWRWLQNLAQDVRFALRLFTRDRGFALTAVLVLAVGIGMTNAVFTMVNGLIYGGVSKADDRIMVFRTQNEQGRFGGLSRLDLEDWREGSRSFSGIAAHYTMPNMNITDDTYVPESVAGTYVSFNAFRLLEIEPILGRAFLPEDEQPLPAVTTVILSYGIWQRRYAGDPTVLGRQIRADDRDATVIGVMPPGFSFPYATQFWLPMPLGLFDRTAASASGPSNRSGRIYQAFGRLADGVTEAQARADLESVAANVAALHPATNKGIRPSIDRMSQFWTTFQRSYLVRLLGAVLFVLLIGCANVASLLLARSAYRAREMAFRLSLGATRWRLIRQLLVESLLLALVAGIAGLGISALAIPFFEANVGKPYWVEWKTDGRVLSLLAATCLGTGLLFGLAPALHVSKVNLNVLLKEGSRMGSGGAGARRWTMGLLVAEFALTLTLLSGAGLMMRSFLLLYRDSQVIDPSGLVTMQVRLGGEKYIYGAGPERRRTFYNGLQDALAGAPEIESSTMVSEIPLRGAAVQSLLIDGRPKPAGDPPRVSYITVGARYFETLGLPLLRGRPFSPLDGTPGHHNAIVNQRFVDMFFPDEDPIGRHIRLGSSTILLASPPPLTIVGVSPTVRQVSNQEQPDPVVYAPFQVDAGYWAQLIVRPRTNLETVVTAIRREVSKLDAGVPISNVRLLEDAIAEAGPAGGFHRRLILMLGIFAGMGVVLAAVGIYAVTAYTVAQRTQEIGLRMALGARASQVVGLFVRQATRPLALGVLAGLGGAFVAGRLLQTWLVKPATVDPASLLIVAVLLMLIGLTAAFWPSWRASRVDPGTALRNE